MKTLILISLLFSVTTLSAEEFKYVEVEVRGGDNVYIDYGEGYEGGITAKKQKKDNGELFLGTVDVLTYFENKGWELYKWSAMNAGGVSMRIYLFKVDLQLLSDYLDTLRRKTNALISDLQPDQQPKSEQLTHAQPHL